MVKKLFTHFFSLSNHILTLILLGKWKQIWTISPRHVNTRTSQGVISRPVQISLPTDRPTHGHEGSQGRNFYIVSSKTHDFYNTGCARKNAYFLQLTSTNIRIFGRTNSSPVVLARRRWQNFYKRKQLLLNTVYIDQLTQESLI